MVKQAVAEVAAEHSDGSLEDALIARLDQVLGRLRVAGIPFCLQRNRDLIPSGLLTRSDVDLAVPRDATRERLITFLADLNPVQIISYRNAVHCFYFPVGSIFLRVDFLNRDPEWRGACFLENREILAHAWNDQGMPVASEVHQAFVAWFQKLLWSGSFPLRYVSLISRAAQNAPEDFRALLEHAFGPRLAYELWELAEQNRLPQSEALVSQCRRALWLRALRRHPVEALRARIEQVVLALVVRAKPAGLDVAVLGPDGAGKSTVCSLIANDRRVSLPFDSVEGTLLYQRVLPPLSAIKGALLRRPTTGKGDDWNPHARPEHMSVVSAFKFLYYTLDQWLGELLRNRNSLANNVLLLRDRHLLELVIDPKRYRYGAPMWLARWITRLMPKPDLVILLDAPAEVLQARKQEVPYEETARQRDAYRTLIGNMSSGRIIDASQPLEQVVADVKDAIVESVAARTSHRFARDLRQSPIQASFPGQPSTLMPCSPVRAAGSCETTRHRLRRSQDECSFRRPS